MRHNAQELSDALDLEFWCEREGIEFKPTRGSSGPQLNLRECPVCGDRRYRVYMNAETGAGNCFVCNETFSKLKFIKAYLGLEWREVFKHVQEVLLEQGWRPKRTITAAVEMKEEIVLPLSVPLPTEDGQNLVYLERRGIDGELARYFHLRFCREGWWRYRNDVGSTVAQPFDNRVIIPVFDLDGTLVTFQGRDITGTSDRKYLFPATLPGTGRFLYNGQNAVKARRVVMGEGAFDVIALKKALDEDVNLRDVVPVGSFGKHLSYGTSDGNDQLGRFLQLRRDGLEEVTIMWDGEEKALLSALDAASLIHRIGVKVRIALLPPGKDPNEVDGSVVRQVFYEAKTFSMPLSMRWRLSNPYAKRAKSRR